MSDHTSIPVPRTQLQRPMVARDVVLRKSLHWKLDAGVALPLTLVSAPAGYGKSTLVSHWIEESGRTSAWVSLDEGDGDIRLFRAYFLTAIRECQPGAIPMINRLQMDEEGLRYVGKILGAFALAGDETSEMPNPERSNGLAGTLTERRLMVLRMPAEQLSNREIGARLYISPGTVKRHTHSIYGKLAVGDRRAAVATAKGSGILSE